MSDDTERWLPVVGYEDAYEVSDQGRVRSVDRLVLHRNRDKPRLYRGCVLKPHPDDCGYPEVLLSRRSKSKTVGIHRLVCAAFHGAKPEWAHGVRHLNGKPADNRPENLAWGTRSQNMQDKRTHGTNYWINRTHCKNGHEWTAENTVFYPHRPNRRFCRTCVREKSVRRRAA